MGKWCLHASLFIFDRIIIEVAGNQVRHKSSVKFDFGPNQTTHFGVTCPWVTKISHFRTWISLKPVGQSWSNFMCSIIRVGERLHKVLGQIDLAHCTQVSDRCPLGYLFFFPNRWKYFSKGSLVSSPEPKDFSETIVVYDLKLATDDRSDNCFCWHQNFVPWGLYACCPEAIYMY